MPEFPLITEMVSSSSGNGFLGTRHVVFLLGSDRDPGFRVLASSAAPVWAAHTGGRMRTLEVAEHFGGVDINALVASLAFDTPSLCLCCGTEEAEKAVRGFLEEANPRGLQNLGVTFSIVVSDDRSFQVPDWCPCYRVGAESFGPVSESPLFFGDFLLWGVEASRAFFLRNYFLSDSFLCLSSFAVDPGRVRQFRQEVALLSPPADMPAGEDAIIQAEALFDNWSAVFRLSGRDSLPAKGALAALLSFRVGMSQSSASSSPSV